MPNQAMSFQPPGPFVLRHRKQSPRCFGVVFLYFFSACFLFFLGFGKKYIVEPDHGKSVNESFTRCCESIKLKRDAEMFVYDQKQQTHENCVMLKCSSVAAGNLREVASQ